MEMKHRSANEHGVISLEKGSEDFFFCLILNHFPVKISGFWEDHFVLKLLILLCQGNKQAAKKQTKIWTVSCGPIQRGKVFESSKEARGFLLFSIVQNNTLSKFTATLILLGKEAVLVTSGWSEVKKLGVWIKILEKGGLSLLCIWPGYLPN